MEPDRKGPERQAEKARTPSVETERSGGGAYAPPPPPASRGPGASGGKSPWMPIAIGAVVVLAALGVWMASPSQETPPPTPPAITAVAEQRVLQLSDADIDWVATKMAQDLIRSGTVPPAPSDVAAQLPTSGGQPAGAAGAPTTGAPTTGTTGATAAVPTVAPVPKRRAPTMRATRRVPRPGAPSQVALAPPPQVANPTPSAAPSAANPTPSVAPSVANPTPATPSTPAADLAPTVPPAEMQVAVRAIVEQAPEQTRQDIVSGKQVIYKLQLLDELYPDNDQVEIFVNGRSYGVVVLTKAGTDLALPFIRGATSDIKALARWDGGGGVTFGARSSLGERRSRVMAVGQSDDWRVTAP